MRSYSRDTRYTMKLAIIADVHGNLAALDRVLEDLDAWGPDEVVVAGDVVNRGPQPAQCMQRLAEHMSDGHWHFLQGNHEQFVLLEGEGRNNRPNWEREVCGHSRWTYHQLGDAVRDLEAWPLQVDLVGPGGEPLRFVHASMRGTRHGLYAQMTDEQLHESVAPAPALLGVGHTHIPFIKQLGGTLIVNGGAVGLPFDRDTRAAYARLEYRAGRWHAEVVRLEYDLLATERAFEEGGYLAGGGPMVPLVLDELRNARPRLRAWHDHFEARVAAGEMTVEESVSMQLAAGE